MSDKAKNSESTATLAITPAQALIYSVAGKITIEERLACARWLVRGNEATRAKASDRLGEQFGIALPAVACTSSQGRDVAALWLGPDEWLVLAPREDMTAATQALEAALDGTCHMLIDVSDRHIEFRVSGPLSTEVLNTGCPIDLDSDAFPAGMCTRTLLGKAEVILWRISPEGFRIECQRSYKAYVAAFLLKAAQALTAY